MEKYFILTVLCVVVVALVLTACTNYNSVLDQSKTYGLTSNIKSLDIKLGAADFSIEYSDKFSLESNLKHLSVSEKNGVLVVVDETKLSANYENAVFKLYIPKDVVFENVNISTGAAQITSVALSANTLKLKLGAGKVQFASLNASSNVEIKGGTGDITVTSGTLNNLKLSLGVGKLDMTATLLGKNNLKFGVGDSNLTLLGNRADYNLNVEKGIGTININGNDVSDYNSSGKGNNYVSIEGGVGTINVSFLNKTL